MPDKWSFLERRRKVIKSMSGSWSPSSRGAAGDGRSGWAGCRDGAAVATARGASDDGDDRETRSSTAKLAVDLHNTIYQETEEKTIT